MAMARFKKPPRHWADLAEIWLGLGVVNGAKLSRISSF
jgi:hypothetical protein